MCFTFTLNIYCIDFFKDHVVNEFTKQTLVKTVSLSQNLWQEPALHQNLDTYTYIQLNAPILSLRTAVMQIKMLWIIQWRLLSNNLAAVTVFCASLATSKLATAGMFPNKVVGAFSLVIIGPHFPALCSALQLIFPKLPSRGKY